MWFIFNQEKINHQFKSFTQGEGCSNSTLPKPILVEFPHPWAAPSHKASLWTSNSAMCTSKLSTRKLGSNYLGMVWFMWPGEGALGDFPSIPSTAQQWKIVRPSVFSNFESLEPKRWENEVIIRRNIERHTSFSSYWRCIVDTGNTFVGYPTFFTVSFSVSFWATSVGIAFNN